MRSLQYLAKRFQLCHFLTRQSPWLRSSPLASLWRQSLLAAAPAAAVAVLMPMQSILRMQTLMTLRREVAKELEGTPTPICRLSAGSLQL